MKIVPSESLLQYYNTAEKVDSYKRPDAFAFMLSKYEYLALLRDMGFIGFKVY
jgi:hypothetical protein